MHDDEPAPSVSPWRSLALRSRQTGMLFASVWLVFLLVPLRDSWRVGGWEGAFGIALLLAFIGVYLWVFFGFHGGFTFRGERDFTTWDAASVRHRLTLLLAMVVLAVLLVIPLGGGCLYTTPYIAVCAATLGSRWAAGIVLVTAGVAEGLARFVPGWGHMSGMGYSIIGAGLGIWGVLAMAQRNVQVVRAKEAEADLKVVEERTRFSRDLHDILGHSLTVITVKAELAGRLLDLDMEKARAEIADLERISREALVDVRRAVEGYRELSLSAELARARATLMAAGIDAEIPRAADDVSTDLRELFAWGVREGVTNVVRHSQAKRCRIELAPTSLVIEDDGRGQKAAMDDGAQRGYRAGNGLVGLRERAEAVGAEVTITESRSRGVRLTVQARKATS